MFITKISHSNVAISFTIPCILTKCGLPRQEQTIFTSVGCWLLSSWEIISVEVSVGWIVILGPMPLLFL